MKTRERREYLESTVLAYLLAEPSRFPWELEALEPSIFAFPLYRQIAQAMCSVRDSGRRLHWRRVRCAMRRAGTLKNAEGHAQSEWGQRNGLAFMPRILARSVASTFGMDHYLTELRRLAAKRRVA